MSEMHSEIWWERALDGELSAEEQRLWNEHLATCESCRQEWAALAQVDWMLRMTPAPALPVGFEQRTLMRVHQSHRQRRTLTMLAGGVGLLLLVILVGYLLATTFLTVEQTLGFVVAEWNILLVTLVRPLLSILVAARVLIPLLLLAAGISLLVLIPNGALATLAYLWVSRRYVAVAAG